MAGGKREIGGAVLEAGGTLIAEEARVIAEEEEVLIVVVVVIEPDGFAEGTWGEGGVELLEDALAVLIEEDAAFGEDAEVGETIVVEIAGSYGDHVLERGQTGVYRIEARAEEVDAAGGPEEEVGAAVCIEIEHGEAGGWGVGQGSEAAVVPADGGGGRGVFGGGLFGRLVDLGVEAPVGVFGVGSAGVVLLLEGLEAGEGLAVFLLPARFAVDVEDLKAGRHEVGVQISADLEFAEGLVGAVEEAVDGAEVIVADGLVRHETHHLMELVEGAWYSPRFL